eukprot:763195-Hanusia_phi.AAC.2
MGPSVLCCDLTPSASTLPVSFLPHLVQLCMPLPAYWNAPYPVKTRNYYPTPCIDPTPVTPCSKWGVSKYKAQVRLALATLTHPPPLTPSSFPRWRSSARGWPSSSSLSSTGMQA